MLTITENHMEQFNRELLDFYNSGNSDSLKDYMYQYAIQGIEF